MNKIATYLNEHLLGEVAGSKAMRRRYSRDGSILSITPEIIVFPRVTNDIRKVARFTWQLAEKGHPLGVTVRGNGMDTTGAAIGKGIVISMSQYLNDIITVAPKDKLVHIQPGITIEAVQAALTWQGLTLAQAPTNAPRATIGGILAGNVQGPAGSIADNIEKMEVVLANGDMIETGRIGRHDLNKKLGLQTFEGEIYRKLEGLIEDNEELITKLAADPVRDNAGYASIARVKAKDGSFDLTPLFIGSQGTLGIISEVVLRTEFYSRDRTMALVSFAESSMARDFADRVKELEPSALKLYDGELFRRAGKLGTRYGLLGDPAQLGSVLYVEFNDFSDRGQAHKLKKLKKLALKLELGMIDSTDRSPEEFKAVTSIADALLRAAPDEATALPVLEGLSVPSGRQEEFFTSLAELAHKHHVELPTVTNVLTGAVDAYPLLKLTSVGDKQKLFKLMNDAADLANRCGGSFVSSGGEGRVKVNAAWSVLDDAETALFEQVRDIFDPFGTLNPGVKQKNELRTLVASLRSSYDAGDFVS